MENKMISHPLQYEEFFQNYESIVELCKNFIKIRNEVIDDFLSKTPGLKVIYNSVKDTLEAFVGDKKKFNEPVVVQVTDTGLLRAGFITQKDLEHLGLPGYVSVYLPACYAFSGELYLAPADKVKPLNAKSSAMMQFIVSGGVTNMDEEHS
jgi:uncharacterized membrane protein